MISNGIWFQEPALEYVAVVLTSVQDFSSSTNSSSSSSSSCFRKESSGDTVTNKDDRTSQASYAISFENPHLMPIAGIPCIVRLLHNIELCGFEHCVIGITKELRQARDGSNNVDDTIRVLEEQVSPTDANTKMFQALRSTAVREGSTARGNDDTTATIVTTTTIANSTDSKDSPIERFTYKNMKVSVVRLTADSFAESNATETTAITSSSGGSGPTSGKAKKESRILSTVSSMEAMRRIERSGVIASPLSNVVVFPGDIVLLDPSHISRMIHLHRSQQQHQQQDYLYRDAMLLLCDVGEQDEQTRIPLKESAKQKKGIGFVRDEEEIDYIAVSTSSSSNTNTINQHHHVQQQRTPGQFLCSGDRHRVIWKQPKLDVEEDKHMVGATPKLTIPRTLLLQPTSSTTSIRTDYFDVHVYIFPPWIRRLMLERNAASSIQRHLIPLLLSRQFKGILASFNSNFRNNASVDHQAQLVQDLINLLNDQRDEFQPHYANNSILLQKHCNSSHMQDPVMDSSPTKLTNAPDQQRSRQIKYPKRLLDEYSVLSYIVDEKNSMIVRSYSISSSSSTLRYYLYANKELAHRISAASYLANTSAALVTSNTASNAKNTNSKATLASSMAFTSTAIPPHLFVPTGTIIKSKYHSLILPGITTTSGTDGSNTTASANSLEKITMKSFVAGEGCSIGMKCRFNNVVLGDHVQIGDNCTLQNTVVGSFSKINGNCSLSDCQVYPHTLVPANTKAKNETFQQPFDNDNLSNTTSTAKR